MERIKDNFTESYYFENDLSFPVSPDLYKQINNGICSRGFLWLGNSTEETHD